MRRKKGDDPLMDHKRRTRPPVARRSRPAARTISVAPVFLRQKTTYRRITDPKAKLSVKELADTVDIIVAYSVPVREPVRTNELPLFGCQRLDAIDRLGHEVDPS